MVAVLLDTTGPDHCALLAATTASWTPFLFDGMPSAKMVEHAQSVWNRVSETFSLGNNSVVQSVQLPPQVDSVSCGYLHSHFCGMRVVSSAPHSVCHGIECLAAL